jgi:hypothetical protein
MSTVLLAITWLPIGLGTNKFNTLEGRQNAATEAFLATCDNARRVLGDPDWLVERQSHGAGAKTNSRHARRDMVAAIAVAI